MTLEQLQYFVAIVESATFFDAAESLHIAQSMTIYCRTLYLV